MFSNDTEELIINPITKMVSIIKTLAENPLDTLHALPSQQEAEQVAEHVVHLPVPHLPAHGHADHVHVHVANESSH